MWYSAYTFEEVTNIAWKHLQSLELWLRRLVHYRLTEIYGKTYQNKLSRRIRQGVERNMQDGHYSRWIDATSFDLLKDIVLGEQYERCFEQVFQNAFGPLNSRELLRVKLNQLIDIRNQIDHHRPHSIRDCEKAICYSNDIIDAIKDYYQNINMQNIFNAPNILLYRDQDGQYLRNEGIEIPTGWRLNLSRCYSPGDSVAIQIEVDQNFPRESYRIEWILSNGRQLQEIQDNTTIRLTFATQDINKRGFLVTARVIHNLDWHVHSHAFEDELQIYFKVEPPIN